jgi:hypothetical protein
MNNPGRLHNPLFFANSTVYQAASAPQGSLQHDSSTAPCTPALGVIGAKPSSTLL